MINYGERIAMLRIAKHLTQAQLGKMLNVSSQAVSKWEHGLSEPDLNTTRELCEILGISISDFFAETFALNDTTEPETVIDADAPSDAIRESKHIDKPVKARREYVGKDALRKRPWWGVFAGIAGTIAFFSVIGVIAGTIIVDMIAGNTGVNDNILGSWWQTLLIVTSVVFGVAAIAFLVLFILAKVKEKKVLDGKRLHPVIACRPIAAVMSGFFAVLTVIAFAGGAVANANANVINSELGLQSTRKVSLSIDEIIDSEYYKSDYVKLNPDGTPHYVMDVTYDNNGELEYYYIHQQYSNTKLKNAADAVARQIQTEGTTMLWNDGGLPLAAGNKISLFGLDSAAFYYSGTGSAATYGATPEFIDVLQSDTWGGMSVNKTLYDFYKSKATYVDASGNTQSVRVNNQKVGEPAWSEVTGMSDSFGGYGDAAVICIGRASGENADLFMTGADTIGGDYLELHKNEKDMIEGVISLKKSGTFKKVILLLNTPTSFNFDILKNYRSDIDGCLWVGMPGGEGLYAIAQILGGKVNPSGHLANVFPYYNMSAPATVNGIATRWNNYGEFSSLFQSAEWQGYYMAYLENIYVGYKYYETRYFDAVCEAKAAEKNASSAVGSTTGGDWVYADEVAFPFGYGTSYTDFAYDNFSATMEENGDVTVKLTVRNSGDARGADAVQVYVQKPYTDFDRQNGIEKTAAELCGYFKTDELDAGGTQEVTVTVKADAFKTYDANVNKKYIVEAGDYYIAVGSDSHAAVNNILAKTGRSPENTGGVMDGQGDPELVQKFELAADTEKFERSKNGTIVTNAFDDVDWNKYENNTGKITYLSRSDWAGTYPARAKLDASKAIVADLAYEHEVTERDGAMFPTYGADNGLKLIDLKGLEYGNEKWSLLLDQMSLEDQAALCAHAYHGTAKIDSVGKPADGVENGALGVISRWGKFQDDLDGQFGTQFPSNAVLSASFNDELALAMGKMLGENMLQTGRSGLYAPSINIQRTAYGGRNFEYYSEDSFISGQMALNHTLGIQSKGGYVQIKHFALNDLESNRHGVSIWANEQSVREIYLSAFEPSIVDGNARGVMSSFTRAGAYWCGADEGLMSTVLRNEWGFEGYVVSDCSWRKYMGMIDGILVGNDCILNDVDDNVYISAAKKSPTVAQALRESCHRILFTVGNSSAMNGVTSNVIFMDNVNWWQKAIIALQVCSTLILTLCAAAFVVCMVLKIKPDKEKEYEN